MKKNVLLIGVGGIGFRHFQSLFNSREDICVFVVDINEEAIKHAEEYATSLQRNNFYFAKTLETIPTHIDIAIIATTSIPRRLVFENLVNKHFVKKIIFEKFLFPKIEDYDYVANILQEKKIEAYVDCPARMYDIYNLIKGEIQNSRFFIAKVRGSNWGLACNSIHIVDLIAYLSDSNTKDIRCQGLLEDHFFDSKRNGYVEFFGTIFGNINNRTVFSIECNHANEPLVFEFFTDQACYSIIEEKNSYTKVSFNSPENVVVKTIDIPYVSQLTNINVDGLLNGNKISLPTYDESRPLHEALLSVFLNSFNIINHTKTDCCPIT